MSEKRPYIVEVDAFEGAHRSIRVLDSAGMPARAVYCVAVMNDSTGVLQFVDYGYTSEEEAREAWPAAL